MVSQAEIPVGGEPVLVVGLLSPGNATEYATSGAIGALAEIAHAERLGIPVSYHAG